MVLVAFNYKDYVKVSDQYKLINYTTYCTGSLIDRLHVVTSAHCFKSRINIDMNEEFKEIEVKPTYFYSSVESMYSVYLGTYNKTKVLKNDLQGSSIVVRNVSEFVKVFYFILLNFVWLEFE